MAHKYNPSVTELRQAYEVAHGEQGVYMLYGALFANASTDVIERLYSEAIAKVRQDLEEKELI